MSEHMPPGLHVVRLGEIRVRAMRKGSSWEEPKPVMVTVTSHGARRGSYARYHRGWLTVRLKTGGHSFELWAEDWTDIGNKRGPFFRVDNDPLRKRKWPKLGQEYWIEGASYTRIVQAFLGEVATSECVPNELDVG